MTKHLFSRGLALLVLGALFSTAAWARTVTDHAGRIVNIPNNPMRIVSLHDWTLTVMAHELGAPLIASSGRIADDGTLFMRGARELFALDFNTLKVASIQGKPDPERIMMLKPDLILANSGDYLSYQEILSAIAPTLMFNPEQGRPMLEMYGELAQWLGRENEFSALKKRYDAQLDNVRQRLSTGQKTAASYVALLVNGRDGTIEVLKDYGVLTTVMDDLGLRRIPVTRTISPGINRIVIGAELIEAIDADYILTSYLPEQGEDTRSVWQDLECIAPGALGFLRAPEHGHLLSFPRYLVYPPSFRGLMQLLEQLQFRVH